MKKGQQLPSFFNHTVPVPAALKLYFNTVKTLPESAVAKLPYSPQLLLSLRLLRRPHSPHLLR